MHRDEQEDSVFAYCECGNFDLSVHMDVETREVLLAYSSISGPEGHVDPATLRELEAILVRRQYV